MLDELARDATTIATSLINALASAEKGEKDQAALFCQEAIGKLDRLRADVQQLIMDDTFCNRCQKTD